MLKMHKKCSKNTCLSVSGKKHENQTVLQYEKETVPGPVLQWGYYTPVAKLAQYDFFTVQLRI
jgi:hypothetical protein